MLNVGRTRGQCAVLPLVVAGLTNREIADLLVLCTQAAYMHLSHFLDRLAYRWG